MDEQNIDTVQREQSYPAVWILKGNNKINSHMSFLAAFYSILCLSNSFHLTGLLICLSENEKTSCVTGESAAFWLS